MEATHARLRTGFDRLEARVASWAPPAGAKGPLMQTLQQTLQPEPSLSAGDALPGGDSNKHPAGCTSHYAAGHVQGNGSGYEPCSNGGGAADGVAANGVRTLRGLPTEAPFPGFPVPAGRGLPEGTHLRSGSPARASVGSPVSPAGSTVAALECPAGAGPPPAMGSPMRRPLRLALPGAINHSTNPSSDYSGYSSGSGEFGAPGMPPEADMMFAEALMSTKGGARSLRQCQPIARATNNTLLCCSVGICKRCFMLNDQARGLPGRLCFCPATCLPA